MSKRSNQAPFPFVLIEVLFLYGPKRGRMFPKQNQSKTTEVTWEVSNSRPYHSPDKTAASQKYNPG